MTSKGFDVVLNVAFLLLVIMAIGAILNIYSQ